MAIESIEDIDVPGSIVGFFDVPDDALRGDGIHAGDQLSYCATHGELATGQVYIVRENVSAKPKARVYVRDEDGERFSTSSGVSFRRTAWTRIDGRAVGCIRRVWR